MQKTRLKFRTVAENPLKTEMISLSYDVNGHVYSKSKSIQLCSQKSKPVAV